MLFFPCSCNVKLSSKPFPEPPTNLIVIINKKEEELWKCQRDIYVVRNIKDYLSNIIYVDNSVLQKDSQIKAHCIYFYVGDALVHRRNIFKQEGNLIWINSSSLTITKEFSMSVDGIKNRKNKIIGITFYL